MSSKNPSTGSVASTGNVSIVTVCLALTSCGKCNSIISKKDDTSQRLKRTYSSPFVNLPFLTSPAMTLSCSDWRQKKDTYAFWLRRDLVLIGSQQTYKSLIISYPKKRKISDEFKASNSGLRGNWALVVFWGYGFPA